jgi:hypothetical protein
MDGVIGDRLGAGRLEGCGDRKSEGGRGAGEGGEFAMAGSVESG